MNMLPAGVMTEETLLRKSPVVNIRNQRLIDREQALFDRFKRIQSRKVVHEVVYEFSQDRGFLHQYYRLREDMYRKMFATDKFDGEEDVYDKVSHILIARRGRLVLGGCRLTIREGDEMWGLPMESPGFKLRELFPTLPLTKYKHSEISRFAIMEDSGGDDIMYGLCKVLFDTLITSHVHYLYFKSTYPVARNWRMVANSFAPKTTRICTELAVPENPIHPGVKWFLTMMDLSGLYQDLPDVAEASTASPLHAFPKPLLYT